VKSKAIILLFYYRSDNELLQAHIVNPPKNKPSETPNDDGEGKLCEVCAKVISKKTFHYHPELLKTCQFCNRKFQRNIESHLKDHDKSKNQCLHNYHLTFTCFFLELECDICGFRYKTIRNIRFHMARHVRNTNYYECDICKKTYSAKSSLKTHKRIHILKEFKCPYEGCNAKLKNYLTQKSHFLTHDKTKRFDCDKCGKNYKRLNSLRRHKQQVHAPIFRYCDLCPAYFKEKLSIRAHIQKIHSFEATYCKICDIKFKLNGHLESHNIIHGKNSQNQIRNHNGKYKCGDCFRTFAYESELKKHSHKRKFGFSCSKCSENFTTQEKLWSHIDIHKAEYPFQCEVCKERFKQINYLNQHALKHKKVENPFICDHCGKEYQRKNHLGAHWKSVKNKKDGIVINKGNKK
jgi:KRAB domain-containing zinc finger protein